MPVVGLSAPAKEITGGPWYTDQEFDYEFVKHLSNYVLSYVKEQVCSRCFPECSMYLEVTCSVPVFCRDASSTSILFLL